MSRNLDFITFKEAHPLLPSGSPTPPSPIPSRPFPFLKLPREIRDSIYRYALLLNEPSRFVFTSQRYNNWPEESCDRWKGTVNHWLPGSTNYWGTEFSTRLFRVNHQVCYEALELIYSTSFFDFTIRTTVSLVNATIRDTLTPWARSMIRNIGFHIYFFYSHSDSFTLEYEEERRKGFVSVMKLLPNVTRVELTLEVSGSTVPHDQVKKLVARALRIISPLRDIERLILKRPGYETAQETRIWREVCEALAYSRRGEKGSHGYIALRPKLVWSPGDFTGS